MSHTSAHIQVIVDRIIAQTDEQIGHIAQPMLGVVYEGEDGWFVTAQLTPYEMYLVDLELAGRDIADANYAQITVRH